MRYIISTLFIGFVVLLVSFRDKHAVGVAGANDIVTTTLFTEDNTGTINTEFEKKAQPVIEKKNQSAAFVEYAKTLIGTPYLYGSTDPDNGLDCSGFINAVSNHFGIKVPRSSVEFTDLGMSIETDKAKPGDLILFTGSDPKKQVVGHIGIITDTQNGQVEFIHSSSGKAKGVTISDLEGYYETRFVKVIRIFPAATADA